VPNPVALFRLVRGKRWRTPCGPSAERNVAEARTRRVAHTVWLTLDAPATLTGKFVRDRKVIPC
jgi:hypothetical protein